MEGGEGNIKYDYNQRRSNSTMVKGRVSKHREKKIWMERQQPQNTNEPKELIIKRTDNPRELIAYYKKVQETEEKGGTSTTGYATKKVPKGRNKERRGNGTKNTNKELKFAIYTPKKIEQVGQYILLDPNAL